VILGDAAWPQVQDVARCVLIVPLGSTEQHGPHLPFSTDTDVAVAVARRAADARRDVVVAPALPYGSSGEHAGFAGTLSIGQDALEHAVVELVRSADAFGAVVLASGHGGNAEPLARAARTLQAEGRRVATWTASGYVDAHAGRTETSLMLALAPQLVGAEAAVPGDSRPIAELLPALRSGGVRSVSATGILGDPTGASAAEGHAMLDALVRDLLHTIDEVRGDG
jgi:creatinine amidohydrolase